MDYLVTLVFTQDKDLNRLAARPAEPRVMSHNGVSIELTECDYILLVVDNEPWSSLQLRE